MLNTKNLNLHHMNIIYVIPVTKIVLLNHILNFFGNNAAPRLLILKNILQYISLNLNYFELLVFVIFLLH